LYRNAVELRAEWADPVQRKEILQRFDERGISFEHLAAVANQPDADPLDLLCHLAFNAPLRTRRERAQRLRSEKKDFFDQFGPEARQILDELLDKCTDYGAAQFTLPDVLQVPPIATHGNVLTIAGFFGGEDKLGAAIKDLQALMYAS
jgi:type I restriction enzyme R subunit